VGPGDWPPSVLMNSLICMKSAAMVLKSAVEEPMF
jgi:hypothetical protein